MLLVRRKMHELITIALQRGWGSTFEKDTGVREGEVERDWAKSDMWVRGT